MCPASPSTIAIVNNDPNHPIPATAENAVGVEAPSSPRIPWSRKILALLIAVAVDAPPLCLLGESIPVLFDVGVATLLWLVLGRSRLLAVALLIECIPGVGLAPTWTLYVLWEIFFNKPAHQTPSPPLISKTPQ